MAQEGVVDEGVADVVGVPQPGTSWARRVLLALCAAHAGALLLSASGDMGGGFWLFLALNALAIAGLVTRTRAGWVAALLCILIAAARWTGAGIDESGGLMVLLAVAAAIFCITAPSLRREHGIAG